MRKTAHAPSLSSEENVRTLLPRNSPYWNIMEYCRHIGLQKHASGKLYWMARIRRLDGGYSQTRLGPHKTMQSDGLNYEEALKRAKDWFNEPETLAIASQPYPVGVNRTLQYSKTESRFTVGDAMHSFVEWKRIAAAKTSFETTLSLINHHIIPRLGHLPVEDLNQSVFTQFCIDVLETAPKRGRADPGVRVRLQNLDHERLRKRKKTLNTIIGLLRTAIEMSWENGDVENELYWLRLRRVPHADTPRQFFLTRAQAKRLGRIDARRIPVFLRSGVLFTGISFDQAGVNRHPLAADQPFFDATRHRRLEQVAQQLAFTETTVSVLREGGMVGNAIVQIETTKPALGQVQMHLFTQPPFGSNAEAVANQKHPDQQFRIDGRTTSVTI